VQLAHRQQGRVAHVQAGLHHVAQFEQAHAQAIAAGLRAVDEAAGGQVVEDAVGGGRMQAGLLADLLQGDRFLPRRQHVDQREHALDDLDGRGGWALGVFLSHGRFLAQHFIL
jgi:hypothetical protein